ncbi:outer spore wall protein RRT8 [Achaetomium macrosporum]|uniref:Outer spore wall protein RRT8 n=1 Tax=Achaetomium macrosporum TaxID=79813 RepID=A0AAN7CI41_9PEZI|nr:outer spore wall protein RRT8 [Achaetomium macrosporum]
MPNQLADKAQEIAKEDLGRAKVLLNEAARSRSYLYPIKGIIYFFTHPGLWKPLRSRLIPYLTLYSGVLGSMFFFTYLPQVAILTFVNGPLAIFTTVLLILNESATITSLVSKNFLLQDALLDTFDGTLMSRNKANIVAEGRELKTQGDSIQRLGKALKKPFSRFSVNELIRYFMYLPLNFIPVVGTVAFILIRGRSRGESVHERYFQLKAWSASRKSEWLKTHKGPYTAFGTVATLLEMIPLASILFSFTNTVGAALWAADIETGGNEMVKSTAPELREAAKKAE